MTLFVDTSAWYALLAADDPNHARAESILESLVGTPEPLVTHNYVVIEAAALVDRRLGRPSARRLLLDLLPLGDIEWIQPSLHDVAVAAFLGAGSGTSFIDHVSFALMRARGITHAFAFDDDFVKQGFALRS